MGVAPNDSGPAIDVRAVSKRYRLGASAPEGMLRDALSEGIRRLLGRGAPRDEAETILALDTVSLQVGQDEVVGVIGRNGSGKTTLLKLLSRITYPTSGELEVRGRVASLVEVGTGFHPELSGRENVYLNGSILGLKRREIEARFDEIVAYSGVEAFLDTPIKRYSTGMRLRLGFAVAAHLFPDVLLVDEVLAVGDAEFQAKCLATMNDVGRRGHTVLFVSHNLEAVESICPRTIWLDRGILRADGPSKEVIAEYLAAGATSGGHDLDLTDVSRAGTGEARILRMELLDGAGSSKEVTRTGDALRMRFTIEFERPVTSPYLGVAISTEFGALLAHPNTWTSGLELGHVDGGVVTVELHVPRLPLMPGTYPLTVWLNRHGDDVSVDWLEHITSLNVHAPDSDVIGRTLPRRTGAVHLDARWSRID